MMTKTPTPPRILALLSWILPILLIALVGTAAGELPGEVTIDAAVNDRPAVTFPHRLHTPALIEDCAACHHKGGEVNPESAEKPMLCSECHLHPEGDVPDMASASQKTNPFHMLCAECHKAEEAGPRTCDGCHVKSRDGTAG